MMLHTLRSRGDTDFEEINKDCIPCLEMAFDAGVSLDLDQRYFPRLFKTHAWFRDIPRAVDGESEPKVIWCVLWTRTTCAPRLGLTRSLACSFASVIRDPIKAAVSFYHFLGNWFFSKDEIGIDEFIQSFVCEARGEPKDYTENAGIFHVIKSYYERRSDERVMLVCYENLVRHKRVHTEKLAEFLGIPCDQDLVDLVEQLSSKEWMAAPETAGKFDEHFMKRAINEKCGLDINAGLGPGSTGKVRVGKGGSDDVISDQTRAMLEQRWRDVIEPATGCDTYGALLDTLRDELYADWW